MDAAPLLARIAQVLEKHGLEAVLIGNAAAALQGATVTTVDFDFFFRKTPANLKKLKRIAADLGAIALHPYHPASGLIRLMVGQAIQPADPLSSGSNRLERRLQPELAAPQPGRRRLRKPRPTRKARLEALKKESELALPPEKRTHFLRKRIGFRMSAL